jgi:hypothetical protein
MGMEQYGNGNSGWLVVVISTLDPASGTIEDNFRHEDFTRYHTTLSRYDAPYDPYRSKSEP